VRCKGFLTRYHGHDQQDITHEQENIKKEDRVTLLRDSRLTLTELNYSN
jgi:hypothetical protein